MAVEIVWIVDIVVDIVVVELEVVVETWLVGESLVFGHTNLVVGIQCLVLGQV